MFLLFNFCHRFICLSDHDLYRNDNIFKSIIIIIDDFHLQYDVFIPFIQYSKRSDAAYLSLSHYTISTRLFYFQFMRQFNA